MDPNFDAMIDPHVSMRIKDIAKLASLPQVTWELIRLLGDDHTSPDDLQAVVEKDPALSAKILSLSNSAFYSLSQPVSTIARAITVIGFKELEFMVLGLGLAESFDLRQAPDGFDGDGLWMHGLAVAWIAREISGQINLGNPSEMMLAGLMHEIGQIVLVSNFTVQLQRMMALMKDGKFFYEAEIELGLWHEVVGYILAKQWQLPMIHQSAILYHHRPELSPEFQKEVTIVSWADHLAGKYGFGLHHEGREPDLEFIYDTLNLNIGAVEKLENRISTALPKTSAGWLGVFEAGRAGRIGRQ